MDVNLSVSLKTLNNVALRFDPAGDEPAIGVWCARWAIWITVWTRMIWKVEGEGGRGRQIQGEDRSRLRESWKEPPQDLPFFFQFL